MKLSNRDTARRMETKFRYEPDEDDEGYSLPKWGLILVGLVVVMIGVLARWGGG